MGLTWLVTFRAAGLFSFEAYAVLSLAGKA